MSERTYRTRMVRGAKGNQPVRAPKAMQTLVYDDERLVPWWGFGTGSAEVLDYDVPRPRNTDLSLESVPDSQGGSPPRRRDTTARERPHHNATCAPAQAAGTGRELRCIRCGGSGRRVRERNPQGWPTAWSECRHD